MILNLVAVVGYSVAFLAVMWLCWNADAFTSAAATSATEPVLAPKGGEARKGQHHPCTCTVYDQERAA